MAADNVFTTASLFLGVGIGTGTGGCNLDSQVNEFVSQRICLFAFYRNLFVN